MRLLLALILALSLIPLATAQVPPACGPLAAAVLNPGPVAPGDRVDIAVTVYNNGSRAADVTVSIAPLPEGWSLVGSQDQTQAIERAATGTFPFTVSPTDDARGDLTTSFQIGGICALPTPGVECPQNACTASTQPAGGVVRLAPPSGTRLPGLGDLDIPLEYLVAGVVLVGVAGAIPLLLRKKAAGFVAGCPEPLKLVRPGRGTSFPLEIRNASPGPLTAQFEIGPIPEGWTAFMPVPEVQLAGKETRSLWLMVRAPPNAAEGDSADVEIRLRSTTRPDVSALVRVRAEVNDSASDGTTIGA